MRAELLEKQDRNVPPPYFMETFEHFMRRALHDPKHGYYARNISNIGSRGDFTTAPLLSGMPTKAIAAWASRELKKHDCSHLIEIGPGTGALAKSVWRNLPFFQRLKTRLHLVETSLPLAAHQRSLLGTQPLWHTDLSQALKQCGGKAVIYSNELVDAFPVRRFRFTEEGWQELALEKSDHGKLVEKLIPVARLPESSIFRQNHPPGQWVEVHESYHLWLKQWLPHWKDGSLLTIDYGATAENLYHRRPYGSVRAYLLQHRLEGPAIYDNIGRQDLTADVNFTDLIEWSSPWLGESRLLSFREFLQPFTAKNDALLADEQGVGEAFRVLIQQRQ
ncbi:MAG: SAM-dependent methyltransferase [Luteolibacter sp.]